MGIERLNKVLMVVRHPVESATAIISAALFVIGLYVLSPLFVRDYTTPLDMIFETRGSEFILGAVIVLCSIPGLVFPFAQDGARVKLLKVATFMSFLWFLFFAILRISSIGWLPLTWLTSLIIAIISGLYRIFLEVKKE